MSKMQLDTRQDLTLAPSPAPARLPFDALSITLHWTTLLLVLVLLNSGLLYGQVEDRPWAVTLLLVHRSAGVTLWALTVFRLAWRWTGARFPDFPASMSRLHRLAVRLSEYGLYGLLLLQPATGFAQTVLLGRPFGLFAWTVPPVVAVHLGYAQLFHGFHELGAWCLMALVGLHAAAAIFHHFVRRDDVLEAMAPVLRRERSQIGRNEPRHNPSHIRVRANVD
jgi:superoxide oxidase